MQDYPHTQARRLGVRLMQDMLQLMVLCVVPPSVGRSETCDPCSELPRGDAREGDERAGGKGEDRRGILPCAMFSPCTYT